MIWATEEHENEMVEIYSTYTQSSSFVVAVVSSFFFNTKSLAALRAWLIAITNVSNVWNDAFNSKQLGITTTLVCRMVVGKDKESPVYMEIYNVCNNKIVYQKR